MNRVNVTRDRWRRQGRAAEARRARWSIAVANLRRGDPVVLTDEFLEFLRPPSIIANIGTDRRPDLCRFKLEVKPLP